MKTLRIGAILWVLASFLLGAVPVYADTDPPDSDPTVIAINVYRHLLEVEDRLYLIYANIPYADVPDTTVIDTFIWRLFDTEGTTELGTTTGYDFFASGYGYNIYSMYFTAAENLTWEAAYTLRLSGNPAVFDTPPEYNYPVNISDYTSLTDSTKIQSALTERIILLAKTLDNKWGLSVANSLLTEIESGKVLSINGQAFFRGAIKGIQGMAPALFEVEFLTITATDRTWNTVYSEAVANQWTGTWVETAIEANKTLFGLEYDLGSIIILLILGIALLIGNISLTGDAWNALIDVSVVMILVAKLGLYPLGFLGFIVALGVIFIGLKIFGIVR